MPNFKSGVAPGTDSSTGVFEALRRSGAIESAWSNLPVNQLPDAFRYGPMGGIAPFFRTAIPRVALAKLAATGVIAALVALSATDKDAAFSCALAAAVNFVAVAHYHYILKIRAQNLPPSMLQFASGRDTKGEWIGSDDTDNDDAKVFAQETRVDGLRYSDWTVSRTHRTRLHDIATNRAFPVTGNSSHSHTGPLPPLRACYGRCKIVAGPVPGCSAHATHGVLGSNVSLLRK